MYLRLLLPGYGHQTKLLEGDINWIHSFLRHYSHLLHQPEHLTLTSLDTKTPFRCVVYPGKTPTLLKDLALLIGKIVAEEARPNRLGLCVRIWPTKTKSWKAIALPEYFDK